MLFSCCILVENLYTVTVLNYYERKENMKLGWITYKNFQIDLNNVPVRTIEAIIKDLPEDHEGRAKMQALLKDAYRDLERQLQYEIDN